jgi:hypothetical protein
MIFPPVLLRFGRRRPDGRWRGFWLPLVLLWPFVLLAAIVVSPLAAVLAILGGRWRAAGRRLLLGPRLLLLFCRFRRLRIEVRGEDHEFLLAVI